MKPCRRTHTPKRPRRGARARRGFILFFGAQTLVSNDRGTPPVRAVCPRCGREADLIGRASRHWFTLFFIPVFPISGKTRFTECSSCGAQFPLPAEQLRQNLEDAGRRQSQHAITLYNSLRASPGNAVTLNELLQLYASLKEYDQAVAAAEAFPQALHSSEQCMTTLGRIHLERDRHAEALRWLDAAVARNPMLGEAQYYKALTHLTARPPDPARAVAAARAARNAGYPQAEELLRETEARR